MSNHTPTPWKWQQEIEGPIDMGPAFIVRRFPIYTDGGKFGHPAEAKTEADAEFIIRACNSHDDLLAACEAMLKITDDCGCESCEVCRATNGAKAVVDKAKGKQ